MPERELFSLLKQVAAERGVPVEALVESIQDALSSAYKKKYGRLPLKLRLYLDEEKGKLEVYVTKKVMEKVSNPGAEILLEEARKVNPDCVVGEEIEVLMNPSEFSRIAARTGKNVMFQELSETEKDMLYEEFKKKEGEIVTGTVHYAGKDYILIDLGKTEGIVPRRERMPRKKYAQGELVKAYVLEVTRRPKGPRIILSQTHPNFLRKLFELEVPEIEEGIVTIKDIKREPGRRAKVVVESHDERIDPVGTCVGLRGSRIKVILRELEGEKIDVIKYSDDPAIFIKNSLKPAQVREVLLNQEEKRAKVIVSDEELSLAIGNQGENVRLASKLTGWQIDVRSLGQIEREEDFLKKIPGIGEKTLEALKEAGLLTLKDILRGGKKELLKVPGVGEKIAEKILGEAGKITREKKEK